MDPSTEPTTTKYQQVTVDVPEDRIAEFHAFFARFLAGPAGRRGRGRHGRRGRGAHGRHCAHRREAIEGGEAVGQETTYTEV